MQIRGKSEAIRGYQRTYLRRMVIRGHQRSSEVIRGALQDEFGDPYSDFALG